MSEQKDGMDISICFYNREKSVLEFAGANNPVYIVRDKDKEPVPCQVQSGNEKYILYEIKGDRMPVSIYDKMDPFVRQSVKVLKDDRLYLFSDGICDQAGGPSGRRFMNNSLKTAILETITPEIRDQKLYIEDRINKWQSFINPRTGNPYEQIDDISLMGVKL
jgi:serine phosphatase RsbU (regulator of sigma subunit)